MRPVVMLGECTGVLLERLKEIGWGRMFVRMEPKPYEGEIWGWDNGAFALHTKTGTPRRVTTAELMRWEADLQDRVERAIRLVPHPPLLAVVPDLPFQGNKSLEYSATWMQCLPRDWRWYLAIQDGMDPDYVEDVLDHEEFSGLFLGGTSAFKGQAKFWCNLAHRRGLQFHYGRCGTIRKLRHAHAIGADSLDSALPMWTKVGLEAFIQTWYSLPLRGALPL